MVGAQKVEAKDYYDFFPLNNHRTGDIWRGLPTFGNLHVPFKEGLVITPACDLAAKKSETVTYLPILSVEEYLNSSAFYAEIWTEMNRHLSRFSHKVAVLAPTRYDLPLLEQIEEVSQLPELSLKAGLPTKAKLAMYASFIGSRQKREIVRSADILRMFSVSKSEDIRQRIIQNSYKTDIHFLPRDGKTGEYSALKQHSVVLLRFAQSISFEAMEAAQNSSADNWSNVVQLASDRLPCILHFHQWPIKMMTLKDDFLADLLSRYVGLYGRLGSRDFTDDTVSRFAIEMDD